MTDQNTEQSATLPERPHASCSALPIRWIDRIFDRMSALYGSKFSALWAGSDTEAVRRTWSTKLAGFADMPDAIAKALDACDNRMTPPNLPEFLAMCRDEARRMGPKSAEVPALSYEATPEELEQVNRRINEIVKKPQFDSLGWARKPGSQIAMSAILNAVRNGDEAFVEIIEQHKRDGICDEHGNLLKRWCTKSQEWRSAA